MCCDWLRAIDAPIMTQRCEFTAVHVVTPLVKICPHRLDAYLYIESTSIGEFGVSNSYLDVTPSIDRNLWDLHKKIFHLRLHFLSFRLSEAFIPTFNQRNKDRTCVKIPMQRKNHIQECRAPSSPRALCSDVL